MESVEKEKLNKVWSFHLREMAVEIMRLALLVSNETERGIEVEFHGFNSKCLTITLTETKDPASKKLYTTGWAGIWLDAYDWFTADTFDSVMAQLRQARDILIDALEKKDRKENLKPQQPEAPGAA